MKKTTLISIIIVGIVILIGGGFYSGIIWFQNQIQQSTIGSPLSDLLASRVVKNMDIVVFGEVTDISGQNLILTKDSDILSVHLGKESSFRRQVSSKETAENSKPVTTEDIEIADIKKGDNVDIFCQLRADGSLEGKIVTVLEQ